MKYLFITKMIFSIIFFQTINVLGQYEQITNDSNRYYDLAWSHENSKIVGVGNVNGNVGIWLIDVSTKEKEKLSLPSHLYDLSYVNWSNDSQKIIFDARDRDDPPAVFTFDPTTKECEKITFNDSFHPDFSPDGQRFVAVTFGKIFIRSFTNNVREAIGDETVDSFHPDWSFDGDKILYTAEKQNAYNIWYTPIGSNPVQLTHGSSWDDRAKWSPDGKQIAFVSNRDGSNQVWMIQSDGSNPVKLVNGFDESTMPAWASDGQKLLFCGKKRNQWDVYVYNVITSAENENSDMTEFKLSQNYPNPFNPITIIEYSIGVNVSPSKAGKDKRSKVSLKIYDILGHELAILVDKVQSPGNYKVEFDADGFASGVYFYQLSTDTGFNKFAKMLLLK